MNTKRILFWDSTVSDMKSGRKFGGIAVQLNFWMQIFQKNGWEIHTLTELKSYIEDNVNYHHIRHIKSIEIAWEWINIYRIVGKVRPQLIISRGALRLLYPLSVIGHWFDAKVVMQGASDVNFEPGKASVGNRVNRWLYEKGLLTYDFFISQNEYQYSTLLNYYGRQSIIIPNIWGAIASTESRRPMPTVNVAWVANFRRLKRAEWIVAAAKKLPDVTFALAGAPADSTYFATIKDAAETVTNLHILGSITIQESMDLISNANILACTSEYEGFPNTFLQAWSADLPIVSTVNPNNLITTCQLGEVVSNADEFVSAIEHLLNDSTKYRQMRNKIHSYFEKSHSAQCGYETLMKFINE